MTTPIRSQLYNEPREELFRGRARHQHFHFIRHCWQRPDPFIEAKQSSFQRDICARIDDSIEKYRRGISSFVCINVVFGHGKSDISSRYLPPHFLGEFPDAEVMVVSHTDDKATEFGAFGRTLMQSPEYRELYPDVKLSRSKHGVEEWHIEDHFGKAQYLGIGSGTAGKRGNLIVIDDFFGKREHAESFILREGVWQSFTDDIMTRRAPVTIVLMVVTPWHADDPIARLKKKMAEDPLFPQFEFVKYPAESPKYASGYLFPERFSEAWYTSQKKILGQYAYMSLMQCDPQIRAGNMIRIDKVQFYGGPEDPELPEGLQWVRGWDLASSEKQVAKDDPDFTVGVKLAATQTSTSIPGVYSNTLYIDDVVRGQWEATQRNKIIIDTAIADTEIPIGIESFGAYKDAFTTIENILGGIRSVRKMQLEGDKVSKASSLVPIFEAGNVWMRRAPWNSEFLRVCGEFPGGGHDDDVDAMAVAKAMACDGGPGIF
jgi:predicted phage terminase large subunit-like protein